MQSSEQAPARVLSGCRASVAQLCRAVAVAAHVHHTGSACGQRQRVAHGRPARCNRAAAGAAGGEGCRKRRGEWQAVVKDTDWSGEG